MKLIAPLLTAAALVAANPTIADSQPPGTIILAEKADLTAVLEQLRMTEERFAFCNPHLADLEEFKAQTKIRFSNCAEARRQDQACATLEVSVEDEVKITATMQQDTPAEIALLFFQDTAPGATMEDFYEVNEHLLDYFPVVPKGIEYTRLITNRFDEDC